ATGTVQFFDGATLVASVTLNNFFWPPPPINPCGGSNPYMFKLASVNLPAVSPGAHTYTAVYSGDAVYAPSTSTAVPVTVLPRPMATTTTTTLSASPNAV